MLYHSFMEGSTNSRTQRIASDPWLIEHLSGGIPCTSLLEQDGLLAFLGHLDDRINLLRETNATLEAIAQALFKSWFVDFDPVRAKAEGRQPEGMDATTADLFPDSFEESGVGLGTEGVELVPEGELLVTRLVVIGAMNHPSDKNEVRVSDHPMVQRLFLIYRILGACREYRFDTASSEELTTTAPRMEILF